MANSWVNDHKRQKASCTFAWSAPSGKTQKINLFDIFRGMSHCNEALGIISHGNPDLHTILPSPKALKKV
jgi:hypothetical protein